MKAIKATKTIIGRGDALYPEAFEHLDNPPERLYVLGEPAALKEGIAIIGARRATDYGREHARRFGALAAARGITVINGGARGCDAAAIEGALSAGGRVVAFLGGGCDRIYPPEHAPLFQRIADAGGAIASEHRWDAEPKPHRFIERNRLTAALGRAVLIVESGVPSGSFRTCDFALDAGREVWAVPGSIDSPASRGANLLIEQGARPIIGDGSYLDALRGIFPEEHGRKGGE